MTCGLTVSPTNIWIFAYNELILPLSGKIQVIVTKKLPDDQGYPACHACTVKVSRNVSTFIGEDRNADVLLKKYSCST